ncbi:MAG: hypothetical protein COT24_01950 [Candidatus Kerfeldbacteria bacterium CG08_land_8_20_14_0_20_40_16]|uniref:DAGKc domain-containing protein n=1 Tax=Candidatus Kerfeldbacteria bacterium CG08_land_8_20_14_0_20_40_16 TaxID=2014244 RepID=A0A2H0YW61_9BACT|nr:MAG: hypothetical protein COT24_01950 [Candidatus Kerfeldbacteria bacterium CG08_land_8_20_14_0_20_40_16]
MDKKYYFIVNPKAGERRKLSHLSEIQSFCQGRNLKYETVLTKQPKEATNLARKAAHRFEVIVAVGGDGTINEVVNGIVDSSAILGTIPIGSGNDFAKEIGLSRNLKKDLKILLEGKIKEVDLGLVNNQYYFINGLGVGFDGEAASRVRKFTKYISGYPAYLMAVLRTLATYKFRKVKITFDHEHIIEKQILLVATCNGKAYGGGFNVAPSAKIDDGLFTVCLVDKVGRFYALRHLPKFTKGTHLKLPEVHTFTAKNVIIESEDELQSQADGELLPLSKRFSIDLLPKKIMVITEK